MAQPKARNPLVAVVTVLVLAVLGLGAMVLVQKAGKSDPGKVVAAPANAGPGGVVLAPAEGTPNRVVTAPEQVKTPEVVPQPDNTQAFPADIDDYLKFLKRIEARKQALIRSQTGDLLLMMTQAKALSATIEEKDYNDTFKSMNGNVQKNSQDWNALNQEFNNRQPPPACVDLRNKYLDQLGKIQSSIFAVSDALAHVQSNPQDALHVLTGMQGQASANIDASIEAADSALADVCDKYRLKKDFDIRGDSSSTGLLR